MKNLLRSFALSALFAAAPVLAAATSTPAELGSDGTIYRLWSGTYGELFGPESSALPADTPVLALDLVAPGQSLVRDLVPGTEGPESEGSAALLFDSRSSSVHAVWNSRTAANQAVSHLKLRSLTSEGWTELIELSAGSLTDKSALRLALTSDDYAATVDGVEMRIARRILHLVWAETANDISRAYYSPVVFIDGRYLGWNPVVALDEIATPDPSLSPAPVVPIALRAAPTLVATPTGRVTVSFIHSQTHHLVAADIQALPGELGKLAEMARGHIVELSNTIGLEDRSQLATMARGHIVELAGEFHPSVATYIGDQIGELLTSAEASADGPTLAEMARGHIVELGREILTSGLASRCAAEELLLEIPAFDSGATGNGTALSHYFVMRRLARWAVPADLNAPDARILVSADGDRATIGWSGDGHLFYREVEADGEWSPARDLDLTQISLADAWDAIARRASGL